MEKSYFEKVWGVSKEVFENRPNNNAASVLLQNLKGKLKFTDTVLKKQTNN